ncbi:MerR family transcriptional regulator [Cohnella silvisoli]|uniref:MerR family transcriptional regulator n=1 Tax=Cohnella silvisoli TaxID=2873699 RepID=A0ABV1KQ76_9BACL|nr:MerR family transcriptional regulator [Cohnella silvisoli]MCD9022089.1 methyltransferase domain-containing protein [Cohnella silvisoli]
MKINEVAAKLKISARAVRFYEEKGLFSPAKQANNLYRTFTEKDVWRLQTIISLREAGMSISDIKSALETWDENNKEELQYYLELQRTVMMSEWLQIKQVIDTTDQMITLLKTEKSLPLEHIYRLAEASKKLREQRSSWTDKWDFNLLASTHDEQVASHSGHYADYDEALDIIVESIAPAQNELGLDIGTGTGNLAARFMELNIAMSAVDQSKEMLRLCQRKYPALETRLGNFLALPYLEGQFDFVVSSFAFHHLNDVQQLLALEEMRRVLKPHGRICIADLMVSNAPSDENIDQYPSIQILNDWFESNGFHVKSHQINPLLHILYAYKEECYDAGS